MTQVQLTSTQSKRRAMCDVRSLCLSHRTRPCGLVLPDEPTKIDGIKFLVGCKRIQCLPRYISSLFRLDLRHSAMKRFPEQQSSPIHPDSQRASPSPRLDNLDSPTNLVSSWRSMQFFYLWLTRDSHPKRLKATVREDLLGFPCLLWTTTDRDF
jgi:hypothetical protein